MRLRGKTMLIARLSRVAQRMAVLLAFFVTGLTRPSAQNGPAWWNAPGVLDPLFEADDFAAINQGQLKQIATAAFGEMQARLPGGVGNMTAPSGTGYKLTQLVNSWSSLQNNGTRTPVVTANTNDFAAVNLGQLKTVAKPFYDRLIEVGYAGAYPWSATTSDDNDFAMANIGQAKHIFAFDLSGYSPGDTDFNGLPDAWEMEHFGHLGNDPQAMTSGGITFAFAASRGFDPNDSDQDDDGAIDGSDQYPEDDKRSEDVRVAQLAVINISGTNTNGNNVSMIALDDDGNAAFAYPETLNGAGHLKVKRWVNGALQSGQSIPLHNTGTMSFSGSNYTLSQQFFPERITTDGIVIGNIHALYEGDDGGGGGTGHWRGFAPLADRLQRWTRPTATAAFLVRMRGFGSTA